MKMEKIYQAKETLLQLSILLQQADYVITFQRTLLENIKSDYKTYEKNYMLIVQSEQYFNSYKKLKEEFEK